MLCELCHQWDARIHSRIQIMLFFLPQTQMIKKDIVFFENKYPPRLLLEIIPYMLCISTIQPLPSYVIAKPNSLRNLKRADLWLLVDRTENGHEEQQRVNGEMSGW